jgi:hypothetical protein
MQEKYQSLWKLAKNVNKLKNQEVVYAVEAFEEVVKKRNELKENLLKAYAKKPSDKDIINKLKIYLQEAYAIKAFDEAAERKELDYYLVAKAGEKAGFTKNQVINFGALAFKKTNDFLNNWKQSSRRGALVYRLYAFRNSIFYMKFVNKLQEEEIKYTLLDKDYIKPPSLKAPEGTIPQWIQVILEKNGPKPNIAKNAIRYNIIKEYLEKHLSHLAVPLKMEHEKF